jgi:hypothetical protein
MRSIVWLASYPKSGNTWVRTFLAHYASDLPEPRDLNDLQLALIATSRAEFDDAVGIEAADLTPEEIARCRPDVYRRWSETSGRPLFVKVHDAQMQVPGGDWLFPAEASAGAVYLVRNPLDVSVSLAHHSGLSVDQAIDRMGRPAFRLASTAGHCDEQLPHVLSSWSLHVQSWTATEEMPVQLVRYEDLFADPIRWFEAVVAFAGLAADLSRVERAVGWSTFDRLRDQEARRGFRERPMRATAPFFRTGRPGGWRDALSAAQVSRIIRDHGAMMARFGYVNAHGAPADEPCSGVNDANLG